MKTVMMAVLAAAFLFTGPAIANDAKNVGTLKLTDAQMDRVTGGVGANNAATAPWDPLLDAGFSLHHNLSSDASPEFDGVETGVAVPSAVPNSVCVAFC